MGTSYTIVLSLEQKSKSVTQWFSEYLLLPSAFQIRVSLEASAQTAVAALCQGPYSPAAVSRRGLTLIVKWLFSPHLPSL